jgi:TolB protein
MYYQSMIDNRSDPRLFSAGIGPGAPGFRTDMQISGMQPRVSPKNDALLFTWINAKTGKRDVYRVSTNGGTPVNLTNSPDEDDFDPVWNRDGSKIAFTSDRGMDSEKRRNFDIWTLEVNRGQPPQRVTSNGSRDDCPVWDPAGNALFFRSNRGGEWGIWRMPLK